MTDENRFEFRARLKSEYEEKIKRLQNMLNSLVAENMNLKKRVGGIEDWMPSIKDVVNWHKNIKVEEQLERE